VVSTDGCATGNGSSISGVAFYTGSSYPSTYNGALFFADHSRNCIWAMLRGTDGLPDRSMIRTFEAAAAAPVDLQIGPDGNLYYADLDGGTVRRITWSQNQAPVAHASASPTSGAAPLTVQFDGRTSSDPDGDPLTYSWDLDGNGTYGDSTSPTPTFTYTQNGQVSAGLRVSDGRGGVGTDHVTITVGSGGPTPVISAPAAGTLWKVGDVISFSGSASDPVDGTVPASGLSWDLVLHHCPTDASSCHVHDVQSWTGVSTGSFTAPDHEYPAYLELRLTATDSRGLSNTVSRRLDPRTVQLTLASTPSGLKLTLDGTTAPTQITRTVIQNSTHTVAAASQDIGKRSYQFLRWSDGRPATHTIVVSAAMKLTAAFKRN
jgi:PKD repeat protein